MSLTEQGCEPWCILPLTGGQLEWLTSVWVTRHCVGIPAQALADLRVGHETPKDPEPVTLMGSEQEEIGLMGETLRSRELEGVSPSCKAALQVSEPWSQKLFSTTAVSTGSQRGWCWRPWHCPQLSCTLHAYPVRQRELLLEMGIWKPLFGAIGLPQNQPCAIAWADNYF